jgi:hypothetical protein
MSPRNMSISTNLFSLLLWSAASRTWVLIAMQVFTLKNVGFTGVRQDWGRDFAALNSRKPIVPAIVPSSWSASSWSAQTRPIHQRQDQVLNNRLTIHELLLLLLQGLCHMDAKDRDECNGHGKKFARSKFFTAIANHARAMSSRGQRTICLTATLRSLVL